jgi:hypothetical protein
VEAPLNTRRHPQAAPVLDPASDPRLDEGLRLFNEGHHWHAHEAWEPLWMGLDGEDKLFLQALVMAAAMLHQYGRGVQAGVRNHWANVRRRFGLAPSRWGIAADEVMAQLAPYAAAAEAGDFRLDPKAVQVVRTPRAGGTGSVTWAEEATPDREVP